MNRNTLFSILLVSLLFLKSYAGLKKTCGASIPIIYSPGYNISVLGIENFHPFDSKKYKKVYEGIIKEQHICRSQFYSPQIVSVAELESIHTGQYLNSLKKSGVIARVVEIPLFRFLPAFILHYGILKPMKLATGGTILGVELALRYGWAINLSGGYHHAKADNGGGFCVFADVPVALKSIWNKKPDLKVLIVDLDAHQGNGNSLLLGQDTRVAILDIYNSMVYPNDVKAEQLVKYNVPLLRQTNTSDYLDYLAKDLPNAIEEFKPGLIIYNAGTDIFIEDQLGDLAITEEGILKRDEFVFKNAFDNKTPILMVLSGGYNKKSGHIIANSINNLIKKNKLLSVPEKLE